MTCFFRLFEDLGMRFKQDLYSLSITFSCRVILSSYGITFTTTDLTDTILSFFSYWVFNSYQFTVWDIVCSEEYSYIVMIQDSSDFLQSSFAIWEHHCVKPFFWFILPVMFSILFFNYTFCKVSSMVIHLHSGHN